MPLLLAVSLLTFLALHAGGVDPTRALAEDPALSRRTVELLRHRMGLDRPAWVQYADWLRGVLLRFDFGESATYHQPVGALILSRLGNTVLLTGTAAVVTWVLAVPLGLLAAVRARRWQDRAVSLASFVALSVPEVLSALVLLWFAARSHWFPVGGMQDIDADRLGPLARALDVAHHLVLPALAVGLVPVAVHARQLRGQLLDVLHLEYVTTARAKGLPETRVVGTHALRNAVHPLLTLFGLTLGSLLSGAFVAETVFGWPGLGALTVDAIQRQDAPLLLGAVTLAGAMVVLGNLVADLLLAAADPRIAHE